MLELSSDPKACRYFRTIHPIRAENHHGIGHAPVGYSDRMTWKDKIILAVAEAERPLLDREIIPVPKTWEPKEGGTRTSTASCRCCSRSFGEREAQEAGGGYGCAA
jgi:hypothetical protein